MLIDLHVQSRYSREGKLEPEEILLRAKRAGLDGICLTEDKPIEDWEDLKALAQEHEMILLAGRSVSTDHGQLLFFPKKAEHVVDAKLFPYNTSLTTPLPYEEVALRAKELGGILAAAAPYRLSIPNPMGDKLFKLKDIDAIEVRNSQCANLINDFALEASFHLKAPGIAGSETSNDLNSIGTAATLFAQRVNDNESLVSAIRGGQIWPVKISDKLEMRPQSDNDRKDNRGGDRGRNSHRGNPRNGERRDSRRR